VPSRVWPTPAAPSRSFRIAGIEQAGAWPRTTSRSWLQSREAKLTFRGFLDVSTKDLIAGWAWDSDHPERPVTVEIFADGKLLAQVTAQLYREDLRRQKIGDGAHAFSYAPSLPIDPEKQSISVIVAGTGFVLQRSQTPNRTPYARPPLNWAPIPVELDADANTLAAIHQHINVTWSALGASEPHWSVLTHPDFKHEAFARHTDRFHETGRQNIEDFIAVLRRSGIELSPDQTCLELGCGVGRLTAWLAPLFARVIATDISATHLQIAKADIARCGVQNVSFRQLASLCDITNIESFDVFFSVIVFQHNPPPIIAYLLKAILAQLSAGGVGYFQIPTYAKGYAFDAATYLSHMKRGNHMEMHVLPQHKVIELIYETGCKLLEIREDGWTGNVNGISNTFLVMKERSDPVGRG
jgi:2-polyprenyl-3-methyl-5-hydroxy-6-metoxy-1,4-benzoquinol methylase